MRAPKQTENILITEKMSLKRIEEKRNHTYVYLICLPDSDLLEEKLTF
jgi:hypothetical protein